VDGSKKSAGRQLADLLAAYGAGLLQGRPLLDYGDWVGLWLNLPRIRRQRAASVVEGTAAAYSPSPLDVGWADALAGTEEEVEYLHYWINAERATARTRAKLGFPAE
jgi:hypothetical protein